MLSTSTFDAATATNAMEVRHRTSQGDRRHDPLMQPRQLSPWKLERLHPLHLRDGHPLMQPRQLSPWKRLFRNFPDDHAVVALMQPRQLSPWTLALNNSLI